MAAETRTHFNKSTQKTNIDAHLSSHLNFMKECERRVLMCEQNLDEEGADAWIENNPGAFNKRINNHRNAIALARFNNMRNVLASAQNSTYLLNAAEKEAVGKYTAPENITETYGKISTDFYQYVRNVAQNGLVAKQTGTSLIQHTINLNGSMLYQYTQKGVSIPYSQLVSANQNIWDKGKFLAYDLETMGGVDYTGQQVLDAITEFSFGMADAKTGQVGDYYGSVIGQNDTVHKEFLNVIKRYESGAEISNRDMVILKRLAKTGHENTSYKELPGKSGLFEFASFASDADIKAMNTRDMRRGADRYLDIYNQQKRSIVTYQGKQMFAWEKRFIEALHVRQSQDLTALGHNSGAFDMQMMQRFTQSNMLSSNAKNVMNDMGLGFDWHDRHMDTLVSLRVTRSNNWLDLYTPEGRAAMKEHGLTHFTLEALTRNFDPTFYDSHVAHVGRTDIAANASMYAKSGLFQEGNANYIFSDKGPEARSLRTGGQMLFYAREGMGMDNNRGGMMSFVDDAFTGDIRTFGGYGIANNGDVRKELFNQYGFQKGVSYTLDNIYEHEMTDDWGNVIKDTHPGMNAKRIVTATFSPVSGLDSFKAESPITIVGTRAEVEQRINQYLLLTGYKDKGEWKGYSRGAMGSEVSELMNEVEIGLDGKEKNLGYSVQNQLEESTLRLQNEAAARARRGLEINKEKSLLDFFNDMDSYIKANAGENTSEDVRAALRKEFHEMVRNQSVDVARGVAKRELSLPGIDMLKTYQEYFGWKERGTGQWSVYRETVDAALNSESYANSIRDIMGVVVDAAEKRGGNDKKLQDFYFKQYFSGLQAYMAKSASNGIDTITNTEPLKIRAMDRNKFEVNLEGYGHRSGVKTPNIYDDNSHILSINLNTSNIGLADRLMEKRGFGGVADEGEKIKEIHRFMNYLAKSNVIDANQVVAAEDLSTHTSETLTQKLLDSLRTVRKEDKTGKAGRLLIGKRQNVTTVSAMAKLGFSKDAVENIIGEIDKTLPNARFLKKNSVNSEVENIVKNLLFDKVEVDDLLKLGYTADQAGDLMHMRTIRMKDTTSFMRDFISGIHKTGAELLYNEDAKEISLIADGVQTRLSNLPRDVFQDGRFYTQVGNMKVSSPVGLYTSKWDKDLKFQSLIGKAHDDLYWMDTAFKRGMKEGDLGDQINRIVGELAKSLRESSSVMKGDMQDTRSDFAFSMYDVIPELQRLHKQGIFSGVDFEQQDEMMQLLNGKELDPEHLTYRARSLITINARNILHGIARDSGDGILTSMVNKFSWDNKEITGLVGTLFNKPHFGDVYGSSKRGIHQQVSRALRFNADDAKASIISKALKDVSVGCSLHTATEIVEAKRKLSGLEYATESAVRVNRLSMRTKDLRKLVNAADIKNQYVKEMLTNIHLEEGAAVTAPEMLDRIFHARATTQKIALYKITEHNLNTIDDLKAKRNLAPQLRIGKDGKITFEYRNGVFVHQGESLINIGGYKDTGQEIYAKEAGMFRFGVFSKTGGLMVDENSVLQTLTRHKDQIMSAADMEQEAYRILNKNYDLAYYVKAFDANPHRKMAEGSIEKNMTRFLAGGLGTAEDGKTAQTLKALGLGDFLHNVPDKEYIESLGKKNMEHTALGAMAAKANGRAMSHKDIAGIIEKNYGSVAEFQKALMQERYVPMGALRGVISNSGLLAAGETFQTISNNFEAELKHQDPVGVIKRVTYNLLRNYGNDADKVHSILKDAIPGLKVKNGQLIAPNGKIHLDKLEEVNKNEKLVTAGEVNGIVAALSQTELVAMDFHDRGSTLVANSTHGQKKVAKGVKFTDCNLQMMEWERYDTESLGRVREALSSDSDIFNKRFAHVLDENGAIKKEYQNQAIIKSIGDQIRRAMFVGAGDKLLMKAGEINAAEKAKLIDKGVNVDAMFSAIGKQGMSNSSSNALEDRYSIMTGVIAENWNTSSCGYSLSDMTGKAGIEVKTLSQLVTSSGANDDIADSIYGKKIMVDFHMDELGDSQLYSGGKDSPGRYLALPYTSRDYIDPGRKTEDARNTFQKKVAQTKQQQANYNSATSTADKAKYLNLVKEVVKGAEYDATFVGRNFMNTVYNKDYLKGLGLTQEEIFTHRKTKGTLSLNVREPAYYKKSASVSALYLSDAVAGNMALSTAVQFESKKGDYDGNDMGISVLKSKDKVNGEMHDIDYASYEILKKKGVDVQLTEETDQIFKDAIASMHYNAADYNKMYRAGEEKAKRDSMDLAKAKAYAINGVLRPQNSLRSAEEQSQLATTYKSIESGMQQKYGDDMAKNVNDMREQGVKYIKTLETQGLKDVEHHFEVLHYGISQWQGQIDDVAKGRKAAAGEANHYLYQHRRLIDLISNSEHAGIDERSAIQKVALVIQEGFLSPKNESTVNVNMLDEFKASLGEMMDYHGERMHKFLLDRLDLGKRSEMNKLPSAEWDADRAAKVFASFGERAQIRPNLKGYFAQGILTKGVNANKKLIRPDEVIDSTSRELTITHNAMNVLGMDSNIVQKQLASVQPSLVGDIAAAEATIQKNASREVLSDSEQLINSIRHKIEATGLTGKSLAFGTMGLAGAVMIAGFVGGNPSKPAETQAQDDSEDEYRIPTLSDLNLHNVRGCPSQGYVININAQTSQGQEHTSNAIQQALSSGFNNTNINVAMNIHNSGEENATQISKMLMSAFQ